MSKATGKGAVSERDALLGRPIGEADGLSLDAIAWTVLAVPLRLALGGIFLAAGLIKLQPAADEFAPSGLQSFAIAIRAFKLDLPEWVVQMAAYSMPWMELVVAAALIVGFWTRAAAAALALMLTGFTALVVQALYRDLNITCGCFGESGLICSGPIGPCKVLENGLLLGAAVALMLTRRHVLAVERWWKRV